MFLKCTMVIENSKKYLALNQKKKKKLGVSIDRIDEDLQWYSPSPTD